MCCAGHLGYHISVVESKYRVAENGRNQEKCTKIVLKYSTWGNCTLLFSIAGYFKVLTLKILITTADLDWFRITVISLLKTFNMHCFSALMSF